MSIVILDMGSGNTCGNSLPYVRQMIDAVKAADSGKHKVILKWQLESTDPPGQKKLDKAVFDVAYNYASAHGYETACSAFDWESLVTLFKYKMPFIKIACQSKCYDLIKLIPRGIRLFVSFDPRNNPHISDLNAEFLACIPEYPAKLSDYPPGYRAYSDHTPGLELWNHYHPAIIEKHFVLERDASNPDAGVFALTLDQLKEIL